MDGLIGMRAMLAVSGWDHSGDAIKHDIFEQWTWKPIGLKFIKSSKYIK